MASLSEVLRLLPPNRQNAARQWAYYSLLYLPLAASAPAAKATVTTQSDSDFIVMRIKAYATDTAAPPVENATPQATLDLRIADTAFGPDQNPVHIQAFAVSVAERRGHDLEFPVLVPRNTALVGFVANLTATAMNLRIHLFGVRIFGYDRGDTAL
jgi:hypothetical protein